MVDDSESSVKGKSKVQTPDESQELRDLKTQIWAKHRLRSLKDNFDEYLFLNNKYEKQHYVIVALCYASMFFGILILTLKFERKEKWLDSFKAVQSATLVSGGSIIAFGHNTLFINKKEPADNSKFEADDKTIQLFIENDLGEKVDAMIRLLQGKKDCLEQAKTRLSGWAIVAFLLVLILVGIEFFDLLPENKYDDKDIWPEIGLIVISVFFLQCTYLLREILNSHRENLEKNQLYLFCVAIPCAYINGLMLNDKIGIKTILFGCCNSKYSRNTDWVKDAYLSPDEKEMIKLLLCGLDPDSCHQQRFEKFCKELIAEKYTERTPLIANKSQKPYQPKLIESVNKIESEANQRILHEYFSLGEALAKRLKGQTFNYTQEDTKEIVNKFPSTDTKEIYDYYIERKRDGLTLEDFFHRYPQKMQGLSEEDIIVAHDALKVYSIFNNIGSDNIKKIKTYTVFSIVRFSIDEISKIINEFKHKHAPYGPNEMSIKIDD